MNVYTSANYTVRKKRIQIARSQLNVSSQFQHVIRSIALFLRTSCTVYYSCRNYTCLQDEAYHVEVIENADNTNGNRSGTD